MIAAQLDTIVIGATCYARIHSPTNPAQVWDTDAQAFANRTGVTAANMVVAGTVEATGFFTASEPAGFSATLNAPVTIHEQAGGSAAATDEYAGSAVTHSELLGDFTATIAGRIDESVGSRASQTTVDTVGTTLDTVNNNVGEIGVIVTETQVVVNELELSAAEPAQVNNTKVVESRVFRLSTRRDGRYWASGPYRPVPGESLPIWIETGRYAGDVNLGNVTGVSSSDADIITFAANAGIKDQYVVLHPTTDLEAADGDRCELLFTFHPMGSAQGVPGALEVVVMGASEAEGS